MQKEPHTYVSGCVHICFFYTMCIYIFFNLCMYVDIYIYMYMLRGIYQNIEKCLEICIPNEQQSLLRGSIKQIGLEVR